MMELSYQEKLRLNKKNYMDNGKILYPMDKSLLSSWKHSKELLVDPCLKALPDKALDKATLNNITENMRYNRNQFENHYSLMHKSLDLMGCCVFYLDSNLSVYAKGGNKELLDRFKSYNIKFSSNFKEKYTGTTAASVAIRRGKPCWVCGNEHYLDILTEYVSYASLAIIRGDKEPQIFVHLFFAPLNLFTEQIKANIELFGLARFLLSESTPNIKSALKVQMLEESMREKKSMLILCDTRGHVVHISSIFSKIFQTSSTDICGKNIKDVFPEILSIINTASNTKTITSKKVNLCLPNSSTATFQVNCVPLFERDTPIGYGIELLDLYAIQSQVNSIINPSTRFAFDDIIGQDKRFLFTKQMARQIANTSSNVLICGESGTGKELFAQAIHSSSDRKSMPYVAINCAAIPKELIGSELFGYEGGAFTGAKKGGAMGKFEQANGGTIFLDEISEMPLDMQAVLLRVIEERAVTRIGGNHTQKVDVRIISATNRDLMKYVQEGKFRLDLYYRLNVIRLDLPPLREHISDLQILINKFIGQFNIILSKQIEGVSTEAFECLQRHSWPGNIRELRNVIECCVNLETTNQIQFQTLPEELRLGAVQSDVYFSENAQISTSLKGQSSKIISDERIVELMKKYEGNKTRVAKALGISRPTLYHRLSKISNG